MPDFLTVNTCAEIVCFVAAVVCLRNDKSLIWKSQILFLAITCAVEIEGHHLKRQYVEALNKHSTLPHGNVWLYNILLVFQALFISLMFYEVLRAYLSNNRLIATGLAALTILYIVDLSEHGVYEKHNNTTLAMSILFVLYSLYYYYRLIRDEKHYRLLTFAPFWWVTGSLFFFFGQIASDVFFNILSTIDIKTITTYTIYKILNVILYSCWTYSFICRRWLLNKS